MNEGSGGGFRGFGRAVGSGMPNPASAVKTMLLINLAVFIIEALSPSLSSLFGEWLAVSGKVSRFVLNRECIPRRSNSKGTTLS